MNKIQLHIPIRILARLIAVLVLMSFLKIGKGQNNSGTTNCETVCLANKTMPANEHFLITGFVKDMEGVPIANALVKIKSSNSRVSTAINGSFSIMIAKAKATLIISFSGYKEINAKVNATIEKEYFFNFKEIAPIGDCTFSAPNNFLKIITG